MAPLRLQTVIRATRVPFVTAVVVPAALGAIIAWRQGAIHLSYLFLTLIGVVSINIGLNLSNDYFDHLSGNDEANKELTPFSGGSRVIQEGILSPRQVLMWSLSFYAVGIAIGVFLAIARGWPLLALGAVGVFLAFFHNAPPVRLYFVVPGLGELATGVGCGPLVVLGSYYVQAQGFSWEALWASIPLGLLIVAVLYINEFPDYRADRSVGKKTIVVVLGREHAVWGYIALLSATYAVLVIGVLLRVFPHMMLLTLLSIPWAVQGIRGAVRYHSHTRELIPTNATTIGLHLVTGLLMCIGLAVDKLLG